MRVKSAWFSGNIFIRANVLLEKGDKIEVHGHPFDHTTICFHGAARVTLGQNFVDLYSPRPDYQGKSHLLIVAKQMHQFEALEDDTILWCVFSHRNAQGEITETYDTGWPY